MKKLLNLFVITALLVSSCNDAEKKTTEAAVETAIDSPTTAPVPTEAPMDSATVAKNWEAYMTPSDVHKMMASWDGKWDGTVSMWHSPDAPPEISKATTTNSMLMGGRYQQGIHTGTMMGQPFEGRSLLAYDNAKKMFMSTWIDNVGTGVMVIEGPWDEASKSMTLKGMMVDPSAGNGKEVAVKEIFKVIDDKNHVMEMYGAGPDGKEFKMMEIKYTRK
jgi:Protein of unknown function (DUF1579)